MCEFSVFRGSAVPSLILLLLMNSTMNIDHSTIFLMNSSWWFQLNGNRVESYPDIWKKFFKNAFSDGGRLGQNESWGKMNLYDYC